MVPTAICKVRGCLNDKLIGNVNPGFTRLVMREFKARAVRMVRSSARQLCRITKVKGGHIRGVHSD